MRLKIPDVLIGSRFDLLEVTSVPVRIGSRWSVECTCDCGTRKLFDFVHLRNGYTGSCGCRRYIKAGLASKRNAIHGMTGTPEHKTWSGMLDRCYCITNPSYPNYGGRGITVCARWLEAFENFYADMGSRPSKIHSLDRVDVNGNYESRNCRWATAKEQQNNRRNNLRLEMGHITKTLSEWSDSVGIDRATIEWRLRNKWSIERALLTPARAKAATNA